MSPEIKDQNPYKEQTFEEFETHFNKMVDMCRKTLIEKNKEYSVGTNRYSSFDESAKDMGIRTEQSWYITFNKHVNAIKKYCKDGNLYSPNETIDTRIMDAMNYLFLLYGIIKRKE